jgi:chromosome segregation ATPase
MMGLALSFAIGCAFSATAGLLGGGLIYLRLQGQLRETQATVRDLTARLQGVEQHLAVRERNHHRLAKRFAALAKLVEQVAQRCAAQEQAQRRSEGRLNVHKERIDVAGRRLRLVEDRASQLEFRAGRREKVEAAPREVGEEREQEFQAGYQRFLKEVRARLAALEARLLPARDRTGRYVKRSIWPRVEGITMADAPPIQPEA